MKLSKKIGVAPLLFSSMILLSSCGSQNAQADLQGSVDQMCDKIKTCGMAELEKQDLSSDMRDMMVGMFDGMCASMLGPHMKTVGQAGLENKAQACVDSMVDASCDELMSDNEQFTSNACKEFEKAAKDAGLDS